MENNVGTIIIGTKVGTKGLKKGLRAVNVELEKFDKNNKINLEVDKNSKKDLEETINSVEELEAKIKFLSSQKKLSAFQTEQLQKYKKQLSELNKEVDEFSNKNDDVKISYYWEETPEYVDIAGETWERVKLTEEERKKIKEIMETENTITKEEQEQINARVEKINKQVDEKNFDNKLTSMKRKAEELAQSIQKKLDIQNQEASNIVSLEQEIALFERQNELTIQWAQEYEALLEKQKRGIQLSETEQRHLMFREKSAALYRNVINEYNKLIDTQARSTEKFEKNKQDIEELKQKYEELINKATLYAEQTNKIADNHSKLGTSNIQKSFSKIGNSINGIIKKIGKWALALLGIRTAMSIVTRSFSVLSQYNTELNTKMNNMRLVLAVGLEPIINRLVQLGVTLLSLLNAITSKLFGLNLFARANELTTQKIADNMGSAASSASELKKQLAGFDEMNVISDTSSSSGGGGGGSSTTPEFILEPNDMWKNWSIDTFLEKGREIADKLATGINDFFTNWDAKSTAESISNALIGTIDIITDFINKIDWKTVGKKIGDFILNIDWAGLIASLIDLLVSLVVASADSFIGFLDAILDMISNPEFLNNCMEAGVKIMTAIIKGIWELIKKFAEIIYKIAEILTEFTLKIPEYFKKAWDKATEIFSKVGEWFGNKFEGAKTSIVNAFGSITNWFSGIWDKIKSIFSKVGNWFGEKFTNAKDNISNAFRPVGDFFNNLWEGIKSGVKKVADTISNIINGNTTIFISTIKMFFISNLFFYIFNFANIFKYCSIC